VEGSEGPLTVLGLVTRISGFQGLCIRFQGFQDVFKVFRGLQGLKDMKSPKGLWPDFMDFSDFKSDVSWILCQILGISVWISRFLDQIPGILGRISKGFSDFTPD